MTAAITPLPAGAAVPLATLHAACFPEDPWDAATLRRLLALPGTFAFVAWLAEAPAGFVVARDLGGEAEILSLGVIAACRRRGLGRMLLDAAAREAAGRGSRSIVLEVAVANAAARRLYAAAGFVQVGRRPRYYRHGDIDDDGLILRCPIAGGAAR